MCDVYLYFVYYRNIITVHSYIFHSFVFVKLIFENYVDNRNDTVFTRIYGLIHFHYNNLWPYLMVSKM